MHVPAETEPTVPAEAHRRARGAAQRVGRRLARARPPPRQQTPPSPPHMRCRARAESRTTPPPSAAPPRVDRPRGTRWPRRAAPATSLGGPPTARAPRTAGRSALPRRVARDAPEPERSTSAEWRRGCLPAPSARPAAPPPGLSLHPRLRVQRADRRTRRTTTPSSGCRRAERAGTAAPFPSANARRRPRRRPRPPTRVWSTPRPEPRPAPQRSGCRRGPGGCGPKRAPSLRAERCPNGALGVVLAHDRCDPDRHDGIADELLDGRAVPHDDSSRDVEVARQELPRILGV